MQSSQQVSKHDAVTSLVLAYEFCTVQFLVVIVTCSSLGERREK